MIRFAVSYLHRRAGARPPGYLKHVLSQGVVKDGQITFEDAVYATLVAKYRPPGPLSSVTSDHWGPKMWQELHQTARQGRLSPAFMDGFAQRLPDGTCGCLGHWKYLLAKLPPPYEGPAGDQFRWSWTAHNDVRARLGRLTLTLEEAEALYPEVRPD